MVERNYGGPVFCDNPERYNFDRVQVASYAHYHRSKMPSAVKAAFGVAGLLLTTFATATTVTYDFNITWVTANPDGAFKRPVVGINGQWPLPQIDVTLGDRVVVNVLNQLGNRTTSLHFHGLYMNGSTEMDGPVGVTQCAIPPGGSFTYDFQVSHRLITSRLGNANP